MVALWYIALLILLFYGARPCGKQEWNQANMSLDSTKSFLGFCAVIVVFHHMSQATCAGWLNPRYIRHGLDLFLTAGYPMVAMFFFCSGYGLYKSSKAKPNFFKRFLPARLIPILIPTAITWTVFILFRVWREIPIYIDHPFQVNGHGNLHPNGWFVPIIILMYLLFYVGFGLCMRDWAGILVVVLGLVGYTAVCVVFEYGTWWYNTPHMFLVGILLAKYEDHIFTWCKKQYLPKLIITIILCVVLWYLGDHMGYYFQVAYTFVFAALYYLLSMKLMVGNQALAFLGKMTLELYLVHGIFIQMFGPYMIYDGVKPVYFIENVPLFVLAVLAPAIPLAFLLSVVDKKVGKLLKPKK